MYTTVFLVKELDSSFQITELTSMGLLHRTSPPDRLDGPPMFKCAISYDDVLGLAKELDVSLNDLLWDSI
jgi:origin recognition complex subunit 5